MCGSRPLHNCLVKIFLPHHLSVIYLLSLPRLPPGTVQCQWWVDLDIIGPGLACPASKPTLREPRRELSPGLGWALRTEGTASGNTPGPHWILLISYVWRMKLSVVLVCEARHEAGDRRLMSSYRRPEAGRVSAHYTGCRPPLVAASDIIISYPRPPVFHILGTSDPRLSADREW